MARPRTLPDSDVFAVILQRIAAEGEKSVAFSAISRATGLAGASLVQRYGSLAQMVEAALNWGWDELDRMSVAAAGGADGAETLGPKGAQTFLKGLTELVGAVLLTEVDVPLREPKEPPAAELDEKVITGEELVLIDVAWVAELEKLRVFDSVVTTVAELVAVD